MLIATYGSLKRGEYNHGRMGPQEYKGDDIIPGFRLHTHPGLPYPCISPEEGAQVHVEVFDVSGRTYTMLSMMEEGAGYVGREVQTKHGPATIWFMPIQRRGWHPVSGYTWTGRK